MDEGGVWKTQKRVAMKLRNSRNKNSMGRREEGDADETRKIKQAVHGMEMAESEDKLRCKGQHKR